MTAFKSEFLTKFIGLVTQNLFIISGIYFIGVSFFANKIRIGITDDNKIIEDNGLKIVAQKRIKLSKEKVALAGIKQRRKDNTLTK